MSALAWLFLGVSLALVWGLTLWCYVRVLRAGKEPPDPVKDFHSA
jgi:hypothetical protein